MTNPLVVSFGGGVNSTALLAGLWERGMRPDAVLFADTGGEKPGTYAHIATVRKWLLRVGFPPLVVVRSGAHASLYEECITNQTLPSKAFGNAGCSVKWKRQPIERWLRSWPVARAAWERGGKVRQTIGIDAGESHRAARDYSTERFDFSYPLIEWGWGREECVEAIARIGLDTPPKSACFFCPSMKKREIIALSEEHPELAEKALEMEAKASLTHVKGLGRHFSWRAFLRADKAQRRLFPDVYTETPCACFDGDDDSARCEPD